MTVVVFPFAFSRPYSERGTYMTAAQTLGAGRTARRAEFGGTAGAYKFVCRGNIRLSPGRGQSIATWLAFVDARNGAFDSFLYEALTEELSYSEDEAIGTGDGSETDFPLDFKHVKTADLVVEIDGTPTLLYSLVTNNTTPIIRFNSAPAGAAVLTASYTYYQEVHFESDDMEPLLLGAASTDANRTFQVADVVLTASQPGAHLA